MSYNIITFIIIIIIFIWWLDAIAKPADLWFTEPAIDDIATRHVEVVDVAVDTCDAVRDACI